MDTARNDQYDTMLSISTPTQDPQPTERQNTKHRPTKNKAVPEEKIKTSIYLPREIFVKLKVYCAENLRSETAVVEEALIKYLNKQDRKMAKSHEAKEE